jgi:hypothetical protein
MKHSNFKAVKFTATSDLSVVDLGEVQEHSLCGALAKEIGNGCDLVERIPAYPLKDLPQLPDGYDLIADESGWFREEPRVNILGSYVYGYPEHGSMVVGDVLIVRNKETDEGVEWVSMTEQEANDTVRWVKLNFDKILLAVGFRNSMDAMERLGKEHG